MERTLYITAYLVAHISLAGAIGFAGLGEWALVLWTFLGFLLTLYVLWRLPDPRRRF